MPTSELNELLCVSSYVPHYSFWLIFWSTTLMTHEILLDTLFQLSMPFCNSIHMPAKMYTLKQCKCKDELWVEYRPCICHLTFTIEMVGLKNAKNGQCVQWILNRWPTITITSELLYTLISWTRFRSGPLLQCMLFACILGTHRPSWLVLADALKSRTSRLLIRALPNVSVFMGNISLAS